MYCPYCGEKLEDDAAFCSSCGKKIPADLRPRRTDAYIPDEDAYQNSASGDDYQNFDENMQEGAGRYGDSMASKAAAEFQKAQKRGADQNSDDDLRKKILIIAAAAIVVIGVIAALVLLLHHSGSESTSVSSAEAASSGQLELTEEEAQKIIEGRFECYAVKTDEIQNTLTFDCYGIFDKQNGTYDNKLGTVQIDCSTAMMSVIDWSADDDTAELGDVIVPDEEELVGIIETDTRSTAVPSGSTKVVASKYVYNCDYGLRLWKDYRSPKGDAYYCWVEAGEEVGFIGDVSGTDYAKVSYDGYVGYINKDYLSDSKPKIDTTVKYSMYAAGSGVKVRVRPFDSSKSLYSLAINAEVGYIRDMVDSSLSRYVKVSYNGTIGYVLKSSLSTTKVTVTTEEVVSYKYIANVDYAANLYASTSGTNAIGMILLGEQVGFIKDANSTYAKVSYNGTTGYINKKYLSDRKPEVISSVDHTMYINGDNVPLRYAPTTAGSVYQYLSSGAEVGFIQQCTYATEYARVKYNNTICFVLMSSLSDTKPQNETKPADQTPSDNNQTPADSTPADQTPTNQTPADTAPADQTPTDTTPADQTPADTTPADTTPADTTPADQTPADTTPADTSGDKISYSGTLPAAGAGSAPSNYIKKSASGSVSLTSKKDSSSVIDSISSGAEVWVVDNTEGSYWYVYVPSLGKYGYVNKDYLK